MNYKQSIYFRFATGSPSSIRQNTTISVRRLVVDIIARCFFPKTAILEDPVTGSAYVTLTSYWAQRLSKKC